MLSMEPVLRTERRELLRMVEDYWTRFPSERHGVDHLARAKRFDEQFWDETEYRFLWWAKLDGAAIGFAKTELIEDPAWGTQSEISEVYITPAFRQQGHGRAFVALILEWFIQRGIHSVRLYVREDNPGAMVFWEKLGFATVQRWSQMHKVLP